VKASFLFVHASAFNTALAAARASGIPEDRIILINPLTESRPPPTSFTIDDAIAEGLTLDRSFVERKFSPGEGRTKIAVRRNVVQRLGGPK
jgi:4-coumarate--CoA ligase